MNSDSEYDVDPVIYCFLPLRMGFPSINMMHPYIISFHFDVRSPITIKISFNFDLTSQLFYISDHNL